MSSLDVGNGINEGSEGDDMHLVRWVPPFFCATSVRVPILLATSTKGRLVYERAIRDGSEGGDWVIVKLYVDDELL